MDGFTRAPAAVLGVATAAILGLLAVLVWQCLRAGGPAAATLADSKVLVARVQGEPETGMCTVCLEDIGGGDDVALLWCQHRFHYDCIGPWLLLHDSCPVCRCTGPPTPPCVRYTAV